MATAAYCDPYLAVYCALLAALMAAARFVDVSYTRRPFFAFGGRYRQILDVLAGHQPLAHAVASIQQETRRYARRQRTYFRHQLAAPHSLTVTEPIWLMDQVAVDAAAAGLAGEVEAFLAGGPRA